MKQKGFTLMELMIVVAIVGIIAAIAYPSYQESVRKSNRTDAKSALLGLKLAQEKLRANCPFYAQTVVAGDSDDNVCGNSAANSVVGYKTESSEGMYTISVRASTAFGNAYTIDADPKGAQAGDSDCDPMYIEVSGTYPDGRKMPAACW